MGRGSVVIAARRVGCSEETYVRNLVSGRKWCYLCKQWHARGQFGKERSRSDGLAPICRASRSTRQKERYVPVPRPDQGRRHKPARSGDKGQANGRISYLVSIGKLPRPSNLVCHDCGHIGKDRKHQYDHFLGYAAEHHECVQPVCTKCHRNRAMRRGEGTNPPRRPRAKLCKRGHAKEELSDGKWHCRKCRLAYYRRYWREVKRWRRQVDAAVGFVRLLLKHP